MGSNGRHRERSDEELKQVLSDGDTTYGEEWYDVMQSVINGKEPCHRSQKCRLCDKVCKLGKYPDISDLEGNQIDTSQVCDECYDSEVIHMIKFREWSQDIRGFATCDRCEEGEFLIELATHSGNKQYTGWQYEKKWFFKLCSGCLVNVDLRQSVDDFVDP